MPALRELQVAFADVVLRREDPAARGLALAPADARLGRRLGVYRANARENFAAALAAAFPVLALELGEARFAGLAASYQRAHPSPSGNLFEIGRRLAAFLAAELRDEPEEYLRDVARLEWAVQEAMVAADCDGRFDPAPLAAVPAADHAALRLRLHPSVRLLAPDYPVFDLWQAFHAAPPAGRRAAGPRARAREHLLVRRHAEGIEIHRLEPQVHDALAGLGAGRSLGDLAGMALAGTAPADPGALLARWAGCGVITGVDVGGGPS